MTQRKRKRKKGRERMKKEDETKFRTLSNTAPNPLEVLLSPTPLGLRFNVLASGALPHPTPV